MSVSKTDKLAKQKRRACKNLSKAAYVLLEMLSLILLSGATVFAVCGLLNSWNSKKAQLDLDKHEDAISRSTDTLTLGLRRVELKVEALERRNDENNRALIAMFRNVFTLTNLAVEQVKFAHRQSVSQRTPFICEILHLKEQDCDEFVGRYKIAEKNLPELKKPLEVTTTDQKEEKKSLEKEQIKEFVLPPIHDFPLRIRRAANDEGPSAKAVNDFWDHYAGNPAIACKLPEKGLKTAEILCKVWGRSITCNLYCVYGSTFSEGIVRTTNCSYADNRWSNYFEECQPFVSCKLKLDGPGFLKCVDNRVMEKPTCQVSCEDYEDKESTVLSSYACIADGTWSPRLPPCASPRNITLVESPEILEHTSLDYPQNYDITGK